MRCYVAGFVPTCVVRLDARVGCLGFLSDTIMICRVFGTLYSMLWLVVVRCSHAVCYDLFMPFRLVTAVSK